jgi:2,4-dienoyl-CoA reductase-like NADH-dependent reductase (Old Yellow Enzyme family)
MKGFLVKSMVRWFGYQLMKPLPFEEGYFLDQACKFRERVTIPLVVVGGLNSVHTIQRALAMGFDGLGMARALIHNPHFVNDIRDKDLQKSGCTVCNYCVAVMYAGKMRCFMNDSTAPEELVSIAQKIDYATV